jgi:hypothetical protein
MYRSALPVFRHSGPATFTLAATKGGIQEPLMAAIDPKRTFFPDGCTARRRFQFWCNDRVGRRMESMRSADARGSAKESSK